jgi:hypothetical protein
LNGGAKELNKRNMILCVNVCDLRSASDTWVFCVKFGLWFRRGVYANTLSKTKAEPRFRSLRLRNLRFWTLNFWPRRAPASDTGRATDTKHVSFWYQDSISHVGFVWLVLVCRV